MQLTTVCIWAASCATGLSGPVELGFHPDEGAVLHKRFEVETKGTLDDFTLEILELARLTRLLRSSDWSDWSNWNGELEVRTRLDTVDEYVQIGRASCRERVLCVV